MSSPQTTTASSGVAIASSSSSPRTLFNGKMSTSRGKDWATAIADSPVKHAIINRPFTLFRMRTETLLDQITGATLPPAVLESERRQREADRQLKCRGCKVLFGDERGLLRHHDLFPSHVNPPEYKRKPKRRSSRRSHSTSDVLGSHHSSSRVHTRHTRAETMATPSRRESRRERPPSIDSMPVFQPTGVHRRARPNRPLPPPPAYQPSPSMEHPASLNDFTRTRQAMEAMPGAVPIPPLIFRMRSQTVGAIPATPQQDYFTMTASTPAVNSMPGSAPLLRQAIEETAASSSLPPSPAYEFTKSAPAVARTNDSPLPTKAEEAGFILPPPSETSDDESEGPFTSLPAPKQADDASTIPAHLLSAFDVPETSKKGTAASGSRPPLSPIDFGSFQLINQETGKGPTLARPVIKSTETDVFEEKNKAAGASSAAKKRAARREEQRKLVRGASESALTTTKTKPVTLQDAARAIIATSKAGPTEPASMGVLTNKEQAMYSTLYESEHEAIVASPTSSSINWSVLKAPLVSTPTKKEGKQKMVMPITTGLTSFSGFEDGTTPTRLSPTNLFPRLRHRSTNPFLNESFMSSLPSSSKTPPLSPSTQKTSPSSSRLPNLNPFARRSDKPVNLEDAATTDEEDYFYDAPKTPPPELNSTLYPNNPFFRHEIRHETTREHRDVLRSLPRSESSPMLSNSSRATTTTNNNNKLASRGVRFNAKQALTASDSPRCPTCRRAFVDLESVLSHIDASACNPFESSRGQAIQAN